MPQAIGRAGITGCARCALPIGRAIQPKAIKYQVFIDG